MSHHEVPSTTTSNPVRDPVCGMRVDPARAGARRERDGQSFSFCSASCAAKFDADPARYARKAGAR